MIIAVGSYLLGASPYSTNSIPTCLELTVLLEYSWPEPNLIYKGSCILCLVQYGSDFLNLRKKVAVAKKQFLK